eukprot:3891150-Pleurochrysis_carterae.AAC.2
MSRCFGCKKLVGDQVSPGSIASPPSLGATMRTFCTIVPIHVRALVSASSALTQIVKALLAAGANPNISCSFGRTPLLVAATMGHRACVELLILNGADVYLRNRKGKSAADAIVDELRMVKPGQPKYINLAACLELILAKHTRAVHEAEERKSAQERTNLAEIDGAAAVLINPDFALLGMTE